MTDQAVLVLLDEHRVATTTQVSAALSLALRTADYRLVRLRDAGLVDRARPYRERGTAPFHWWLTRRGRAVVHGERPGRGGAAKPHPIFLLHTAAVTGFALALAAGGDSGLVLREWRRDEDAWEHWRNGEVDLHVAPDGLLRATAQGKDVAAFVEIDRGTMTQPRLRGKALRHLRYAHDRAWAGRHPWPPPLLLVTTSDERARRFLDGVEHLRQPTRRKIRESIAFAWTGAARHLWIAACAWVDDPERAVTEAVWTDASGARFTLAEGLAAFAARQEALAAEAAAERARREAAEREEQAKNRFHRLLREAKRVESSADDGRVGRMARRLADEARQPGTVDPLVQEVADWWGTGGAEGSTPMPPGLAEELRSRHAAVWSDQARRVVALHASGCRSFRLRRLAVEVAEGLALDDNHFAFELRRAGEVDADYEAKERAVYESRRRHWVGCRLKEMRPWQRRAAAAGLVQRYDDEHLWGCRRCGGAVPDVAAQSWERGDWTPPTRCSHCASERLDPWPQRQSVPTLEESVAVLSGRPKEPRRTGIIAAAEALR